MATLYKTTGGIGFVGDEGNFCWLAVMSDEEVHIIRCVLAGKDCWNDEAGAEPLASDDPLWDKMTEMTENELRDRLAWLLGKSDREELSKVDLDI